MQDNTSQTRIDTKDSMRIKLQRALVAAQKEAAAVEKMSENKFHRYNYASAESIITEARHALSSHGLAVCSSWVIEGDRIHVTYTLMHEEGGEMFFRASTAIVPEKGRPLDKAEATALTYNLGYFLRGLLLLPRVEKGAEPDERDDREHDPSEHLRGEYAKLLTHLPADQQARIKEWVARRGESSQTFQHAIHSMREKIQKQEEPT